MNEDGVIDKWRAIRCVGLGQGLGQSPTHPTDSDQASGPATTLLKEHGDYLHIWNAA